MKNMVLGICAGVFLGILILASYTIQGRSLRQSELSLALTVSMEHAMEQLPQKLGEELGEEEWIQDFLQDLSQEISGETQVQVWILDADVEKGLLSVEAVSTFRHPIGSLGRVAVRRTAILEQYQK